MKIAAAISAGTPGFSVCRRSNWSSNTPSAVTADPSSGMLEFYAFFGLIYILFRADQVAGTPSQG